MNIMAFDTSAKVSSVAVCNETEVIAEFNVNAKLTHSQTIMPICSSLLDCAKLTIDDIDAFAVASGPGSFTGLRIGISAVKGLAQASRKPCIAVSTIDGLAKNLEGYNSIVCVVMDARCDQFYNAMFEINGNSILKLCQDRVISIKDISEEIFVCKKNVTLVGDGAILCYNKVKDIIPNIRIAPAGLRLQRASSIALKAHELFNQGQVVDASSLVPSYIRLPQAQRELKKHTTSNMGNNIL